MPAIKNPATATPEEVADRLKELRGEFTKGFSEGRRNADELSDQGWRSMREEVDFLDTLTTMQAMEQRRTENQRAISLMGAGSSGYRSVGEAIMADKGVMDYIAGTRRGVISETSEESTISRMSETDISGYRSGISGDGHVVGGHTFVRDCFEAELSGLEGRRALNWIQAASRFDGESGYRVSSGAQEWGSTGPPTADSTDSAALLPVGQPIPPVPRRARLWMRDLLPSMTTTLAQVPYVQELTPTSYEGASGATGGAGTVAEAGTKPTAQLSFQGQTARPTVVAATLVISKQLFEDSPAVVQYINGRLPYLVRFQEDAQFLSGNGVWPNVPGILAQSGVQTQTAVNTDIAQTIGMGFAQVEEADGSPNAVVMNPSDAWTMFTKRAAGGAGTFDAGTPFSALPLTVWGVQSYRSRAYPALQALVGDFQLGGMVVDREQVNVQLYRERYAEQNLILLICEERVSAMWFRPNLFTNCQLYFN